MSSLPPIVEADRLVIRPLASDDLDSCHRLRVDIGWADAELSDAENRERQRSWLEWTVSGYREFSRLHQPQYGERAIVSKGDGSFLGLIGMVPSMGPFAQLPSEGGRPGARATPEVGLFWALSPAAQGRGLATEAARAFSAHLFEHWNLARLIATTEHDNARSIAVMRRLGMRVEANPFPDPFYLQVVGILDAPR
ncbi:MAG: GNAT family N-acetyltransferase [Caulobacteraceae bacterium]